MNIFDLPTIEMVAGETHTISLNITNTCFDPPAGNVTAILSLSEYVNNVDTPLFVLRADDSDQNGKVDFTFSVENTKSLAGKYVYQIHLTNGTKSELYNGFLIIYKNRNPGNSGGAGE